MKYFRLCLTILLAILALPAWAHETTPMRLGMDIWPPYEYLTPQKEPAGIAFETTKTVLADMGIKLRSITVLPWGRGLEMLEHGEIDILVSGVRTPEREEYSYYPTEPIMTAQWRLFTNCSQMKKYESKTILSLKGKQIGIVRNFSYPKDFMAELNTIGHLESVNLDETNFRKLANKRIDAVLSDYLNGLWILHSLGLDAICATDIPVGDRYIYPLFSQKTVSIQFVEEFNKELRRFKATPEYEQLLNRAENLDK